uniref:GG17584 n=1 Tax=Drosophila erecta TaxID=7220 RepID=B3P1M9_DROER
MQLAVAAAVAVAPDRAADLHTKSIPRLPHESLARSLAAIVCSCFGGHNHKRSLCRIPARSFGTQMWLARRSPIILIWPDNNAAEEPIPMPIRSRASGRCLSATTNKQYQLAKRFWPEPLSLRFDSIQFDSGRLDSFQHLQQQQQQQQRQQQQHLQQLHQRSFRRGVHACDTLSRLDSMEPPNHLANHMRTTAASVVSCANFMPHCSLPSNAASQITEHSMTITMSISISIYIAISISMANAFPVGQLTF